MTTPPMISVQIVNIDYYVMKTDKEYGFIEAHDTALPVVRIFGSTPAGQKALVHVHGAFPYLYFRPENIFDTSFDNVDVVNSYLANIETFLEEGLKTIKQNGKVAFPQKAIHKLEVVLKTPMYGYHSEARPFVKVYVRHPTDVQKVVTVLESQLLGRRMQPYEAHVPYLLQFLQDYNLFGMGWLHLGHLKFRGPLPPPEPIGERVSPQYVPEPIAAEPISAVHSLSPEGSTTSADMTNVAQTHLQSPSLLSVDAIERRFTQSNTPAHLRWNSRNSVYSPDESGLLEEAFMQSPVYAHKPSFMGGETEMSIAPVRRNLDGALAQAAVDHVPLEKISSCELEMDTHVRNILNKNDLGHFKGSGSVADAGAGAVGGEDSLTHVRSLAELWEEERSRCAAKGEELRLPVTAPYTNTCYRTHENTEVAFARRLQSLLAKGQALNRAVCIEEEDRRQSQNDGVVIEAKSLTPLACAGSSSQAEGTQTQSGIDDIVDMWVQQRVLDRGESGYRVLSALGSQREPHSCPLLSASKFPPDFSPEIILSQLCRQEEKFHADYEPLQPAGDIGHVPGEFEDEDGGELQTQKEVEEEVCAIESSTMREVEVEPITMDLNNHNKLDSTIKGRGYVAEVRDIEDIVNSSSSSKTVRKSVIKSTGVRNGDSDARDQSSSEVIDVQLIGHKRHASNFSDAMNESRSSCTVGGRTSRSRFADGTTGLPMYTAFGGDVPNRRKLAGTCEKSIDEAPETALEEDERAQADFQTRESKYSLSDDASTDIPLNGFAVYHSPEGTTFPEVGNTQVSCTTSSSSSLQRRNLSQARLSSYSSPTIANMEEVIPNGSLTLVPKFDCPVPLKLRPLHTFGIPDVTNKAPFYSNTSDCKTVRSNDVESESDRIQQRFVDGRALLQPFCTADSAQSCSLQKIMNTKLAKEVREENEVRRMYGLQEITLSDRKALGLGRVLQPTFFPPKRVDILNSSFCNHSQNNKPTVPRPKHLRSQLATPTQTASPIALKGMKAKLPPPQKQKIATQRNVPTRRSVSMMSIDIFCSTRKDLLPNPKLDTVQCVMWALEMDSDPSTVALGETSQQNTSSDSSQHRRYGIIITIPQPLPGHIRNTGVGLGSMDEQMQLNHIKMSLAASGFADYRTEVTVVRTEHELMKAVILAVRHIDPDFMVAYDIQRESLGFLIERCRHLTPPISLLQLISRAPEEDPSSRNEFDKYGQEHESGIWITGRTVINLWRRMTEELKLDRYTISNVCSNVLGLRFPEFTHEQLTRWYGSSSTRHRVIRHVITRAELCLRLVDKLDLVRRTAESARLYGIDFFSVMSRGSQYRVEAVMLRVAHSLGFLATTPSRRHVAAQAAMEVIPLVMEPRSRFYEDPVVVLDFQALYPSMIIAYNLCFSTIIGKLSPGEPSQRAGVAEPHNAVPHNADITGTLGVSSWPEELAAASTADHLKDYGTLPFVAPNGAIFCRKEVRHGILPLMLREILNTRIMVKSAMKRWKGDGQAGAVLSRVLDARQLALKMIANVTYGYTAAGFSGRMPMAELADAIVQSGRSTLEWTIREISSHPTWNAEVVYGDTDSVFVLLRGRSRADAFQIGEEIAKYITGKSPPDVLLKMEKVYSPCILVTKKRYVGFAYESPSQATPHFDAKGIETVRRDQCPATAKLQEKALRVLFESADMSRVKEYLVQQWSKLHSGWEKVLLRDLIFSKEVRLGHYSTDETGAMKAQPPAAIVACKAMAKDPMAEPPYRWRVPYVVIYGPPKTPLRDLVVSPEEVLRRGSLLRINHVYYITKCINPALDRVLSLCGVDVNQWYRGMNKPILRLRRPLRELTSTGGLRNAHLSYGQQKLDSFFRMDVCDVCGGDSTRSLCEKCLEEPGGAVARLWWRLRSVCSKERVLADICNNCSKHNQSASLHEAGLLLCLDGCVSLDCPVFFERCRLITKIGELYAAESEASKQLGGS